MRILCLAMRAWLTGEGLYHRSAIAARRLMTRLAHGSAGLTLLEVGISIALLGITGTTVVGAIAGGATGVDRNNVRTNVAFIAQSQLDFVAAQGYREDGQYQLLANVPGGFTVSLEVRSLRPGVLQEVTAVVKRGEEEPTKVTTYHSNRLLETGIRPPTGGLEGTRPITLPLDLSPGVGIFQVVEVLPVRYKGELRARWQLIPPLPALPGQPPVKLTRAISLNVFAGTPLGAGPQGTSILTPAQVGQALDFRQVDALYTEVFLQNAVPGLYTLYFFNRDTLTSRTQQATVSCICPE